MPQSLTTIFRAAAVRDAAAENPADFRPGAVAVRQGLLVAVGEIQAVEKEVKNLGPWRTIDLPDRLILPAMVNAHAHLDLTEIGPKPYPGDFLGWFNFILHDWPQRVAAHGQDEAQAIASGVKLGAAMSRQAGVAYVGDISDHPAAVEALERSGLRGTMFLELVGLGGERLAGSLAMLEEWQQRLQAGQPSHHVRLGLQPHAPYSTGPTLYAAAVEAADRRGLPLCTHLAETTDELRFVAAGEGEFQKLLVRLGRWDEAYRPAYSAGQHPVEWMQRWLPGRGWLLAHCNYVEDAHLAALAQAGASVAYCPIASDYFGHRHHRYRDMLAAGVNVCLGTDSILCQPAGAAQPLGILPQMRHLYRRDGTDPATLLAMATWRGAKVLLGLGRKAEATFKPGAEAALVAVRIDPADPADALVQALLNDNLVEPLFFQ